MKEIQITNPGTFKESHDQFKAIATSPALRDWMIHVRCRASWPHIACILCRECLAWIARCDDWTENWLTYMYVMIARVRLQQKYFCTHFLCACTVGMIFSVHTCSDDSDPCPGHGNVTCTWQLACEGLYRSPILFNARINATFFFFLWIW